MSMKKVVFSSLILLTIITLYITKNNTNKISELIDNNMLAFTIDGENSSFMPKKSSGYKVKSITCKNNSNVVWDNDNWEIEVIKLESEDTCVIDFTTETNFEYAYTGNVQTFTAPTSNYAKIGNGYAKITKSIESVASSVKVITNEPETLDSTNKTTV